MWLYSLYLTKLCAYCNQISKLLPTIIMNRNIPQQPINLDTLVQMQKQLGKVFKQLVSTYIEQSDQLIATMPTLLEQQQYAELQRHAHSIKSSRHSLHSSHSWQNTANFPWYN